MKRVISSILSMCLIMAIAVSALVLPASAFSWDNVQGSYAYYRDPYGANYSYQNGKFYKNLNRVPLTGDGARDAVAVALSQMGYLEGDYEFSGEVGGSGNVSEYGDYMGISGYAWCAAFCSWVYYNAQVTDLYGASDSCGNNSGVWGYIWSDTYVPNWSNQLYDFGYYRFSDYYRYSYAPSQASYKPQPGDLIFFNAGYSPLDEGHIGLVVYSDDYYVYTAEGNTSSQDGVYSDGGGAFFKSYELSSSAIAGYGAMPFNTVSGLAPIDYSGLNPTAGLYINVSLPASVYLNRDDDTPSWTLPTSSIFEVSRIEEDKYGYTMLYSKCEINGETIYGWIPLGNSINTWSRTVQIYAAPVIMEDIDVVGTPFWVTHYNNIEVEGSGSIMTSAYTGGAWNMHVAFAPDTKANTYKITAISDGTVDGSATALSIPAGGFVYTLNRGNDWPSIYASDPSTYSYAASYPDYTSASCDAMIERAREWKVGDTFEFTNLDISTRTVPTTTPYTKWYEDAYKCYSGYKLNGATVPDPEPTPDPEPDPDPEIPSFNLPIVPDEPDAPGASTFPDKLQGAGVPGSAGNIAFGCDLSFYNVDSSGYSESDADYSLVDFKKMKADGCDFAILRLGSSDSSGRYYDPHFVTYYNMAREAGMALGVYYYTYSLTYDEAVADAEFVMDVIEDHGMYFEYPIYLDIEEPDQLALSSNAIGNLCLGWCETLEENGYFPGIYGNYELYDNLPTSVINTYDTWIAWVSSADSISEYTPWAYNLSDECGMWQYSFYGYEYDGIGLDMLDVNVAYKDYPAIMAEYGYNNMKKTSADIVSKDKNYYPDANTRTDDYKDDQIKLTNGIKGSIHGGEIGRYSGWFTEKLDIIVDLGGSASYNCFNIYAATNSAWGINNPPAGLTVSVSDSRNGEYTEVGSAEKIFLVETDSTNGWTTYRLNVLSDIIYKKRYVKFTIYAKASDPAVSNAGHLWLDEIEVSYSEIDGEKPVDPDDKNGDGILDRYNPSLNEEGKYVFENAYGFVFDIDDVNGVIDGEDATLITTQNAFESCNPNWAISVQLRPTGEANKYSVVKVVETPGSAANAGITLSNGDVILVVHSASSYPGDYANWMSKVAALALKEGDIIDISVDMVQATVEFPPHVHTPGTAANCIEPQTCTTCGEVLVAAKGHNAGEWVTLEDGSKEQRCTACNFLLGSEPASGATGSVGDVNADGTINQYDYILVKRHYFGTRYLSDDELTRADVNLDGAVNQYDYILIKRHYFGTYVIG